MILNVSGRTDIVAFYSKWFMNRYNEGFVDVRNPFNPKMISRINFKDVDLIMFCTKNPIPMLKYLKDINKPVIFHVTLTPYKNDIEPNVPNKNNVIEAIKEISKIIGKENVVVRYDPVFLSDKYNLEYHKKVFEKLCLLLDGYIQKIIISFIDDYQNVRRNMNVLNHRDFTSNDYRGIGLSFSESAREHGLSVQTCFEEEDLTQYGFIKDECISRELAFKMTGKKYPKWKVRKEGKCECVQMVDIGVYNSCPHMCKYCYANFDERQVNDNHLKHNPNSSLLIGEISRDDIIKVREK